MARVGLSMKACGLAVLLVTVVHCSSSDDTGREPDGTGGKSTGGSKATGGTSAGGDESSGGISGTPPKETGGSAGEGQPDEDGGQPEAGAPAGQLTECQRKVFLAATHVALPESPAASAAADIDGDGDSDLIVLHRGPSDEEGASWVRVASNDGKGAFAVGERFDVAKSARAVAIGDLDGDGKPDVVVAHGEDDGAPETVNVVSVLLNAGGGKFAKAVSYPAGTAQWSVTLGDVDGNESLDIVVTNHSSSEVRVLANDGHGKFAAPTAFAVAASPEGAAIADLDGDGKADIAVTDGAAAARVLLNQGEGTFAAPVAYGGPPDPGLSTAYPGITTADFDGDGKTDLFVNRSARVLLNQGNGAFAAPVTLAVSPGGDGLTGDFNGDGKVDVALVSAEGVAIRFGNGDGTFSPRGDRAYAASASSLPTLADFDGDGDTDVAAVDLMTEEAPGESDAGPPRKTALGTLTVLHNAGDGSFDGETNYVVKTTAQHRAVAAADLNGDGYVDLATTAAAGTDEAPENGSVAFVLNDGKGVMSAPTFLPSGGIAPSAVAVGDLDGDKKPDLVVCNAGTQESESTVGILLAKSGGSFAPVKTLTGVPGVSRVFYGQFDADPKPDILVSGDRDTYLIPNKGSGNFGDAIHVDIPSVSDVADFNGDGFTDVLVTVGTWDVHAQMNNGDGTFADGASMAVYWQDDWRTFGVASGDFDHDGRLDVVVSSGRGDVLTNPDSIGSTDADFQVAVFLGQKDGTFAVAILSTPTLPRNAQPTAVGTGDFDGDGYLDVVVGSNAGDGSGSAPSAFVLMNRGDNTFFEPVTWGSRDATGALVTARLNGDHGDDLALASGSSLGVFLTRTCE